MTHLVQSPAKLADARANGVAASAKGPTHKVPAEGGHIDLMLKHLRAHPQGATTRELATAAGLKQPYVSSYLKHHVRGGRIEKIKQIDGTLIWRLIQTERWGERIWRPE